MTSNPCHLRALCGELETLSFWFLIRKRKQLSNTSWVENTLSLHMKKLLKSINDFLQSSFLCFTAIMFMCDAVA